MDEYLWTEKDFERMGWHDNHVHGLQIIKGDYGAGQLILDIDYILEWIDVSEGRCKFRILPAVLKFKGVTRLRLALDYETPTAGLGPFSIHAIERKYEPRERYEAQIWTIVINWPEGEIRFEAEGFEQRGVGEPQVVDEQYLGFEERAGSRGYAQDINVTEVSTKNGKHYVWGENCDGWHLAATDSLSVIQERMPKGASEFRHLHNKAEQFFYILSGIATLEVAGVLHVVQPREGFHVSAGVAHTMRNDHETDLEFLVISTPPAHGDRVNV
jgi:mannose-6-phosphate isomerase-like protein (cupin superfamily)